MSGFHAKAWLAWLIASVTLVSAMSDPFTTIAVVAIVITLGAAFALEGPAGRAASMMIRVGLTFLAIRVVLFAFTGHSGTTTLFTLPALSLPHWIGGLTLGGRVTGEVLAQAVADGLKIAALLACFGVFLSVVETSRILRLLPRFLFEAGLVVGIALAFIPSLMRAASEIRDAQRLRGHAFRGARALRPLIVAVLAGGLERAMTLAASMEVRGYGRASPNAPGSGALARTAVLGGLLGVAVGGGLLLYGQGAIGFGLLIPGALALAVGLHSMSSSVQRTRFRAARADGWDLAVMLIAGGSGVLAIVLRARAAAHWYAYPTLMWPTPDPVLLALAATTAAPLVVARIRARVLHRACAPEQRAPEQRAPEQRAPTLSAPARADR